MSEQKSESCAFCRIVRGEEAAEVVARDESWMAFFPLNPATPGHTLVIPHVHVSHLWEAPASLAAELMTGVLRVGNAIQSALEPEGMNLITSKGKAAEQTIFHLHVHIVPRWTNDGFGTIWPEDNAASDETRTDIASRIREAYGSFG